LRNSAGAAGMAILLGPRVTPALHCRTTRRPDSHRAVFETVAPKKRDALWPGLRAGRCWPPRKDRRASGRPAKKPGILEDSGFLGQRGTPGVRPSSEEIRCPRTAAEVTVRGEGPGSWRSHSSPPSSPAFRSVEHDFSPPRLRVADSRSGRAVSRPAE